MQHAVSQQVERVHFTHRKLLRFTAPSIVIMVFSSIYGVVDGVFVSGSGGCITTVGGGVCLRQHGSGTAEGQTIKKAAPVKGRQVK